MKKLYYYEIWIRGKDGYSVFFSTDKKLEYDDECIESEITDFGVKHELVEQYDVNESLGYAYDCSDDKQKVKLCKENYIKSNAILNLVEK